MNNVIRVGRLFNSQDATTIDITLAAIRMGPDKAAEALGEPIRASVLRALIKRHSRNVVMSA